VPHFVPHVIGRNGSPRPNSQHHDRIPQGPAFEGGLEALSNKLWLGQTANANADGKKPARKRRFSQLPIIETGTDGGDVENIVIRAAEGRARRSRHGGADDAVDIAIWPEPGDFGAIVMSDP
jgi:hypothetical protein